jgi:hypothetical protein
VCGVCGEVVLGLCKCCSCLSVCLFVDGLGGLGGWVVEYLRGLGGLRESYRLPHYRSHSQPLGQNPFRCVCVCL